MSQTPEDPRSEDKPPRARTPRSRDAGRDYFESTESEEPRSTNSNDQARPRRKAAGGRDSRDSRGRSSRDSRDSRGRSSRGRDSRDSRGRSSGDSRDSRGRSSRDGGGRDSRDSRSPLSRDGRRNFRDRDSRDTKRSNSRDSGRGADRNRSDRGNSGGGRNDALDDSYYRQGPRDWGSLGRKGAAAMHREDAGPRSDEDAEVAPRPQNERDTWIDEGKVTGRARRRKKTRDREASEPAPRIALTGDEAATLTDNQRRRFDARLNEAAEAYANDRLGESKELLSSLVDRFPSSVEVRELLGLTFYRLGNWKLALRQLDVFQENTQSFEQHHVISDCYRALGQHVKVASVWEELKDASPDGEIVTEGRIVAAGSLADKGDVEAAIRLLQKGPTRPKRAKPYTYRLWYAIADLQEQAGDLPAAREQFRHLATRAPEFGDVQDRLDALS